MTNCLLLTRCPSTSQSAPEPTQAQRNAEKHSFLALGVCFLEKSNKYPRVAEKKCSDRTGQWQLAFALLHVMASEKRADATPNVRTYNSAIAACATATEWEHALILQKDFGVLKPS